MSNRPEVDRNLWYAMMTRLQDNGSKVIPRIGFIHDGWDLRTGMIVVCVILGVAVFLGLFFR